VVAKVVAKPRKLQRTADESGRARRCIRAYDADSWRVATTPGERSKKTGGPEVPGSYPGSPTIRANVDNRQVINGHATSNWAGRFHLKAP
jgi:hypothetical protein